MQDHLAGCVVLYRLGTDSSLLDSIKGRWRQLTLFDPSVDFEPEMKSFRSTFASVGLVVLPLIASVISASNSTCPPAVDYTADFEFVECRQDGYYGRILGRERKVILRDTNTPQYCADYCGRSGYPWAGVEAGTYVGVYRQAMFIC